MRSQTVRIHKSVCLMKGDKAKLYFYASVIMISWRRKHQFIVMNCGRILQSVYTAKKNHRPGVKASGILVLYHCLYLKKGFNVCSFVFQCFCFSTLQKQQNMSVIVSDSASYEGANNISFVKRLKLGKFTSNISRTKKQQWLHTSRLLFIWSSLLLSFFVFRY